MFEPPTAGKALAEVAHQHARLSQQIGTLRRDFSQGVEWSDLVASLNELIDYLASHFADEESLMATRQYPARAEHAQAHRAILDRVRTLQQECEHRKTEMVPVLLDFVQQSLERHEAAADRAFEQFIAELG